MFGVRSSRSRRIQHFVGCTRLARTITGGEDRAATLRDRAALDAAWGSTSASVCAASGTHRRTWPRHRAPMMEVGGYHPGRGPGVLAWRTVIITWATTTTYRFSSGGYAREHRPAPTTAARHRMATSAAAAGERRSSAQRPGGGSWKTSSSLVGAASPSTCRVLWRGTCKTLAPPLD